MSSIIVRGALRDEFLASKFETEIRDENGAILGRFVPSIPIPELGLTDEELAARLDPNAKTYTTAEVLAYLKGLTP